MQHFFCLCLSSLFVLVFTLFLIISRMPLDALLLSSCSFLPHITFPYLPLYYFTLPYVILSYLITSYLISPCNILYYFILSYLIIFYIIISYIILYHLMSFFFRWLLLWSPLLCDDACGFRGRQLFTLPLAFGVRFVSHLHYFWKFGPSDIFLFSLKCTNTFFSKKLSLFYLYSYRYYNLFWNFYFSGFYFYFYFYSSLCIFLYSLESTFFEVFLSFTS